MSEDIEEDLEDRIERICFPYLLIVAGMIMTQFFGVEFGIIMLVGFIVVDRVIARHITGNWLGEPVDVNKGDNNED